MAVICLSRHAQLCCVLKLLLCLWILGFDCLHYSTSWVRLHPQLSGSLRDFILFSLNKDVIPVGSAIETLRRSH